MKHIMMLAALALSPAVWADAITEASDTLELCERGAAVFGTGNYSEAYDIFKPYWPMPEEEISNLAYQTDAQLNRIASRFGEIQGHGFIDTQKAGDSFIQHTFITKFEKHALRFVCVFYKPEDEWIINAIHWDDNTLKLFQ